MPEGGSNRGAAPDRKTASRQSAAREKLKGRPAQFDPERTFLRREVSARLRGYPLASCVIVSDTPRMAFDPLDQRSAMD